jgi:hypothetical protein
VLLILYGFPLIHGLLTHLITSDSIDTILQHTNIEHLILVRWEDLTAGDTKHILGDS